MWNEQVRKYLILLLGKTFYFQKPLGPVFQEAKKFVWHIVDPAKLSRIILNVS